MIKPYLLFAGDYYYPCPGLADYKGSFDTIEEAKAVGAEMQGGWKVYDWYVIVEHATMKEVRG